MMKIQKMAIFTSAPMTYWKSIELSSDDIKQWSFEGQRSARRRIYNDTVLARSLNVFRRGRTVLRNVLPDAKSRTGQVNELPVGIFPLDLMIVPRRKTALFDGHRQKIPGVNKDVILADLLQHRT